MLVVKDDNKELEIIEEDESEKKELNTVEITEKDSDCGILSINSVVGLSNPSTVKVKGKIQDREVIVLIDCGSTQFNFWETGHCYAIINGRYITLLGYTWVWNRHKREGVCDAVELTVNEWKITENFLPLELEGVDVILGMQWLYSLGITEVD